MVVVYCIFLNTNFQLPVQFRVALCVVAFIPCNRW